MEQVLAQLLAENGVVKIVQALADICLEQAKRADQRKQEALWKGNYEELSMSLGSLYGVKCH
jgi:hypothetical protein